MSLSSLTGKWGPRLALFAVSVGAGLLFAVSALQSQGKTITGDLDLPTLVAEKQATITATEQANADLQVQVASLLDSTAVSTGDPDAVPLINQELEGPGVSVELTDAPADLVVGAEVSANDLVVHQEDVNAVMNALWRGGAEAMTVQGVRVTTRTPVRCIGNVILVGGTVYSPPYRIEAIGDSAELLSSLNSDPQIEIYKQYVGAYGIGWDVETHSELRIPPLSDGLSYQMAQIIEESR